MPTANLPDALDEALWTTLACRLTCGCAFHVHSPTADTDDLRHRFRVGHWYGCPIHSDPVQFDPETGDTVKYERDQQIVSIEQVWPAAATEAQRPADDDEVVLHRLRQLRPDGRLALRGTGIEQYQFADAGHLLRWLLWGDER